MATDFFERQSTARRNTTWLVAMFALSVIAIVVTTFFAALLAVEGAGLGQQMGPGGTPRDELLWEFPLLAAVFSTFLIGCGSAYKVFELSGGGTVVAERLGGRRIYPNTTDLVERRLLNVVEEMALASGVPVPPVFLLTHEQGINAFAAGFSPSDAVVAVTRGCAEELSRDQLQGVIAHEFSHILNGDMRLNIRLIGVLHGILLLGLVGRMLLRALARGGTGSRDSKNKGAIYLLAIAAALIVLGLVGTLCGNLIKAAVSRQREYLADASAVQFTRNPLGISGALKRIGAMLFGSKLEHPNAAEMSHMYFAQGVWEGVAGMFATHPPLEKRILALEPSWDGKFPKAPRGRVTAAAEAVGFMGPEAALYGKEVSADTVERAADQVGSPTQTHRQYVQELIAALPPPIVESVREPYGARAVIYATLLDRDPAVRSRQLQALQQQADGGVFELTEKLIPDVDRMDVQARLPLVDMALPALRALTPEQYGTFSHCFQELIHADHRIGLFEWALHQILLRHLRPQFEPVRRPRVAYYGLQQLGEPCSILLSTLARAGNSSKQAKEAFNQAACHLHDVKLEWLPPERCTLSQLNQALEQLAQVAAKHRRRVVDACAACVTVDGKVTVEEGELLRAMCDMLDCPLPPLLPGQPIASSASHPALAQRGSAG